MSTLAGVFFALLFVVAAAIFVAGPNDKPDDRDIEDFRDDND